MTGKRLGAREGRLSTYSMRPRRRRAIPLCEGPGRKLRGAEAAAGGEPFRSRSVADRKRQERLRVDPRATELGRPVEVRSGGAAGASHEADDGTPLHERAFRDIDALQMHV